MEFKIENYNFFHPIEVRWNDLDPLRHVNNVLYFDYFQTARGYFLMEASQTWDWNKHMFVIANISCNFLKEIKLDTNNVRVGARVVKLGSKSFTIEYTIVSDTKDNSIVVHAVGESTQVMIDMKEKQTIELPTWLIEDFKSFHPTL